MQSPYTIIVAPNPSLMTGPGTNTIVLGGGLEGASVIDPAVGDTNYLDAVIHEGAERGGIRRILITHGHDDHIGGAVALQKHLHLSIYGYSQQHMSAIDEEVPDGMIFPAGDDKLRAIYTPGHCFDHLCYLLERQGVIFAGDLLAGVGTVVVEDMQHYLDSLKRLQEMHVTAIVPGHGPVITDPQAKLAEYIAHRLEREQQVIQALEALPPGVTIPQIVQHIYTDVDPALYPIAAHSVEAHLIKLEREGLAEHLDHDGWTLKRPTA